MRVWIGGDGARHPAPFYPHTSEPSSLAPTSDGPTSMEEERADMGTTERHRLVHWPPTGPTGVVPHHVPHMEREASRGVALSTMGSPPGDPGASRLVFPRLYDHNNACQPSEPLTNPNISETRCRLDTSAFGNLNYTEHIMSVVKCKMHDSHGLIMQYQQW